VLCKLKLFGYMSESHNWSAASVPEMSTDRTGSDWIRTERNFGRNRTGSEWNFFDDWWIRNGSDRGNTFCFNV